MKIIIVSCCCLLVLSACNQPYDAPRYFVKTLKPDFAMFTPWQKDKDKAIKLATIRIREDAKSECRSIGSGWYLKEIKNRGEMECEETSDGHRCRTNNVELECNAVNER